MAIALQNLLKNSVRFGHFQFYAGQFDGGNKLFKKLNTNTNYLIIL